MNDMRVISDDAVHGGAEALPVHVAIVSAGELYGGVERFIATLSAHLRSERAADVSVYLFSNAELARELRALGIRVTASALSVQVRPPADWMAGPSLHVGSCHRGPFARLQGERRRGPRGGAGWRAGR